MKLPKSNNKRFILWLILGLLGFLLNYFIVSPIVHTWPKYINFSYDLLYGLPQLFAVEILMLPAFIVVLLSLIKSAKDKKILWIAINTFGLFVMIQLIIYFAIPVVNPAPGL